MSAPARTFDAAAVAAVLHHESMDGLYADGTISVADVVRDPRNYAFLGEHGATVFVRCENPPDTYAILVGVLPDGRGAWGIAFFRACIDAMFEAGAARLIGMIPRGRPASVGLGIAARRGARVRRDKDAAVYVCEFTLDAWEATMARRDPPLARPAEHSDQDIGADRPP